MDNPLTDPPPQLDWPASLMTAAEVAPVLRVTPKTVRQHIRRGSLRALRIDGTGPYRVRAEDAQRWAERQVGEPAGGMQAVDRYQVALLATMQDESKEIRPPAFASRYLDEPDRKPFSRASRRLASTRTRSSRRFAPRGPC